MKTQSIYGTNAGACIVNHPFANIDTEADFLAAEKPQIQLQTNILPPTHA
jgi:hypothetical protein